MKFTIHKFETEILGENIIIKELTKSEFERILKLLKKLRFKRDLKTEKEIKELHPYDFSDLNKSIFIVYNNRDGEAYIEYSHKLKIGSVRLKSKKITAERLISFLSQSR